MPQVPCTRTLFRTRSLLIEDLSCPPGRAAAGGEERVSLPALAFIRRGAFVRHLDGDEILADANQIALFNPGETYRVSHPGQGGDACTAFGFSPGHLRDALSSMRLERGRGGGRFPVRQAIDDSRSLLLVQALRRTIRLGRSDRLAIEELAMRLLRRVVSGLERSGVVRRRARRPGTREAHRRAADRARLFLEAHHAGPVTLPAVAAATGRAPFHLARIFHRETGMTMHRYLNRLRLRAALERLGDDASGITGIALDHGFSSHAHFTTAFHREFGLTPSAFRRRLTAATLVETGRNLEA